MQAILFLAVLLKLGYYQEEDFGVKARRGLIAVGCHNWNELSDTKNDIEGFGFVSGVVEKPVKIRRIARSA